MGLDTTHNCWHGSYESFMRWRIKLCEIAGYGNLDDYEGYKGSKSWLKDDPLIILLSHSDCDGEIAWKDCKLLADSLEKLMPSLKRADEVGIYTGEYVNATQQFIDGLRLAFKQKENVEFH